MNTKVLMSVTALLMGILGIGMSFFPNEISGYLNLPPIPDFIWQVTGALYFGFAMLNWTARANLMGGIYSRPVAIGNLSHFVVAALALAKLAIKNTSPFYITLAAIIYGILAIAFGYVFMNNPSTQKTKK